VGLPAGPIFIAWDGEQYVIKHSLKEIQAYDNLTLIGSLEGSKVQTSLPPKSAPNSASPIRSDRMPSTVHSPVAVSIVGLPAGPIFIAWDGEQYVIKHSLKEIQADDNLTLIGSLEGSKVQTSPPPKSAPNSASPIRSGRMPSTVHSLVAVQRIEAFMAEKGLNQAEFATRAKTTYKTIHKIRKTAKITRSMLDDIAKALGITREELLKKS
jgi:DNA-binding Xre family transcriptional regulator